MPDLPPLPDSLPVPDNPNVLAYANRLFQRGRYFHQVANYSQALDFYSQAINLNPSHAMSYLALGQIAQTQGKLDRAIHFYRMSLIADPRYADAATTLVQILLKTYSWQLLAEAHEVLDRLNQDLQDPIENPWLGLILHQDPDYQNSLSKSFALRSDRLIAPLKEHFTPPTHADHDRIHIGYFSAHFNHHPLTHALTGVIKTHDRDRFQVTCFSHSPNDGSLDRRLIMDAPDEFINAQDMDHNTYASIIRHHQVDILIDLDGHLPGNRLEVLHFKPAPVIINFLGFPATTQANCIDYTITDRHITPDLRSYPYSESVIFLPQAIPYTPPTRSDARPTRKTLSLPDEGIVFANFTTAEFLNQDTFTTWLTILKQVKDSVLWLLEINDQATQNLKLAAKHQGVDPERLVFAPLIPRHQHLTRLRVADLTLDTLDLQHLTHAAESLFAGTPVLTHAGTTPSTRLSTSFLYPVKDLISKNKKEFITKANNLANDPTKLKQAKQAIGSLPTTPLFDLKTFTRHLESAYQKAYKRSRKGKEPQNFTINQ